MPQTGSGRQTGRMKINVTCVVKGTAGSLTGPVKDLSLEGCGVLTSESATVGDAVEVTLRLPTRIEIPAEIRWVDRDPARGKFVVGCRFVHTPASRQALQEGLQKMASSIDNAARRVK